MVPAAGRHAALPTNEGIVMEGGTSSGTVVLVHGGFVDGSGWQGVYEHLKKDGYNVSVVQNPTLSLADDVAVTKRAIDAASEPVILVGHSYGGAVVTEAGTHPKVAALVYIAAFVPDGGESVNTLIARFPARRAATADSAAAGRVSVPRPGEVPRVVRGRRERRAGRVHGRLAGPLGRRSRRRNGQRARVAEQAKLVPRRDRRPDDPATGPARDVSAGGFDRDRSRRQPRDLRIAACMP